MSTQMETQSSKIRDVFIALMVFCALYLAGLGVTLYLVDTQLYKIFNFYTINNLKIWMPFGIASFIACFVALLIPGLLSDGTRHRLYIFLAIIILLFSYIVLAVTEQPSFSCF